MTKEKPKSTVEEYYESHGKDEVLPFDLTKRAASDYIKTAVHMFSVKGMAKGQQTFTESDREHLIENLAKLRMMCCQPDSGKSGHGVDWDEWEFVLSHIAVEAMAMWLAGKLDELEVDDD